MHAGPKAGDSLSDTVRWLPGIFRALFKVVFQQGERLVIGQSVIFDLAVGAGLYIPSIRQGLVMMEDNFIVRGNENVK